MMHDIKLMSDRKQVDEDLKKPKPPKVYCKNCVWCEENKAKEGDLFAPTRKHLCGCPETMKDNYYEPTKRFCDESHLNFNNMCPYYKPRRQ